MIIHTKYHTKNIINYLKTITFFKLPKVQHNVMRLLLVSSDNFDVNDVINHYNEVTVKQKEMA